MARRHVMTARRKAALRKAQLASARKRRRNKRIDRKISRTRARTKKRVMKKARIVERNAYTHSVHGGIYLNATGVRAYQKGARIQARGQRKIKRLKRKKRR